MRIVAGAAAEAGIAALETGALLHLLNMIDRFGGAIFGHFCTGMEHGPEFTEVTSWAEVEFTEAVADDPR